MGTLVSVCVQVRVGWWPARALAVPCWAQQHAVQCTVPCPCSHAVRQILKTLCCCCCYRQKKLWEENIPNPGKSLLIQSYLGARGTCTLQGAPASTTWSYSKVRRKERDVVGWLIESLNRLLSCSGGVQGLGEPHESLHYSLWSCACFPTLVAKVWEFRSKAISPF